MPIAIAGFSVESAQIVEFAELPIKQNAVRIEQEVRKTIE